MTLPNDMVIYAASLSIGGFAKEPGSYSASNTSQIKQGVVVIRGGSATWTGGGGADTRIGEAANWGGTTPDIYHGSASLLFASSGTEATIADPFIFGETTLSATDGFTFKSGSVSYLEPVCCSMSSSNCCFLTCI